MIYKCTNCSYITLRRCDLLRHESKKKPCNSNIKDDSQHKYVVTQNVDAVTQNVDAVTQNVDAVTHSSNGSPSVQLHHCSKCKRGFVRKNNMTRHELQCNGVNSLQCHICLKTFSSRSGKSHHKKVSCFPPIAIQNQPINIIQNNLNNNNQHHITTNNNNNTTTNITQNIQLNFGKECMIDLCNELDYKTKMLENIQSGKYALVRSIDDIYFNERYPNNQTIKKERRNDKMVEILVNGKWEKRLFEDVFTPITSKIENYHEKYFKDLQYDADYLKNQYNKYNIRKFGHQMLWYGWKMSMFQDLGYILNQPDDDEEKKKRIKDLFSLLMEKIYERSHDDNGSLFLSDISSTCSSS